MQRCYDLRALLLHSTHPLLELYSVLPVDPPDLCCVHVMEALDLCGMGCGEQSTRCRDLLHDLGHVLLRCAGTHLQLCLKAGHLGEHIRQ